MDAVFKLNVTRSLCLFVMYGSAVLLLVGCQDQQTYAKPDVPVVNRGPSEGVSQPEEVSQPERVSQPESVSQREAPLDSRNVLQAQDEQDQDASGRLGFCLPDSLLLIPFHPVLEGSCPYQPMDGPGDTRQLAPFDQPFRPHTLYYDLESTE